MDSHAHAGVNRRAADCAAQLSSPSTSFVDTPPAFQQAFRDLTDAVRQLDARFAFDRDGRPDAIQVIRAALPALEREIFDAVIDDHACEVAATQEALYQITLAHGRQVAERLRPNPNT